MILGFCFLVMIIYATYINMNVSARMNREIELTQVVSHCVRQTLWMDLEHGLHTNKQMRAFFEWILEEEMSSKGKLNIDYVVLSQSLGMLSVKVTQQYETPDGKSQQISVKKSASIVEEIIKEKTASSIEDAEESTYSQ